MIVELVIIDFFDLVTSERQHKKRLMFCAILV